MPPLTIQFIHSFAKWKIFWPLLGPNYLSCSVTLRDIQSSLRDIKSTIRDIQSTLRDIQSTLRDIQSTLRDIQSTLRDIQSTIRDIQSTLRDIQPSHLRLLIYSRWYNSKSWIRKNLEGIGTWLKKVLYQNWPEHTEEEHERRNHKSGVPINTLSGHVSYKSIPMSLPSQWLSCC